MMVGIAAIDNANNVISHQSMPKQATEIAKSGEFKSALTKAINHQESPKKLTDVKNGTDFALKQIAEEFEQQIYAMLWQKVFDSAEVSLGEPTSSVDPVKLLGPELMANIIKSGMDPDEFGELAQSVYDDLVMEQKALDLEE